MQNSNYRLPAFSLRFTPIWQRNFLVWKKLAVASVLGNIADPLITLIAFGYGLGSLLKSIDGVPYIHYLASGSICMSIMMAAGSGLPSPPLAKASATRWPSRSNVFTTSRTWTEAPL